MVAAICCCTTPFLLLFLLAYAEPFDRMRAYPSPERHEGVARVELDGGVAPKALEDGDFDGDGIEDKLSLDCFHMKPFGGRETRGLVSVRSGKTGELLLAHAVSFCFSFARSATWIGDLDGNGSNEVLIEDDGSRFALARTTAQ